MDVRSRHELVARRIERCVRRKRRHDDGRSQPPVVRVRRPADLVLGAGFVDELVQHRLGAPVIPVPRVHVHERRPEVPVRPHAVIPPEFVDLPPLPHARAASKQRHVRVYAEARRYRDTEVPEQTQRGREADGSRALAVRIAVGPEEVRQELVRHGVVAAVPAPASPARDRRSTAGSGRIIRRGLHRRRRRRRRRRPRRRRRRIAAGDANASANAAAGLQEESLLLVPRPHEPRHLPPEPTVLPPHVQRERARAAREVARVPHQVVDEGVPPVVRHPVPPPARERRAGRAGRLGGLPRRVARRRPHLAGRDRPPPEEGAESVRRFDPRLYLVHLVEVRRQLGLQHLLLLGDFDEAFGVLPVLEAPRGCPRIRFRVLRPLVFRVAHPPVVPLALLRGGRARFEGRRRPVLPTGEVAILLLRRRRSSIENIVVARRRRRALAAAVPAVVVVVMREQHGRRRDDGRGGGHRRRGGGDAVRIRRRREESPDEVVVVADVGIIVVGRFRWTVSTEELPLPLPLPLQTR